MNRRINPDWRKAEYDIVFYIAQPVGFFGWSRRRRLKFVRRFYRRRTLEQCPCEWDLKFLRHRSDCNAANGN